MTTIAMKAAAATKAMESAARGVGKRAFGRVAVAVLLGVLSSRAAAQSGEDRPLPESYTHEPIELTSTSLRFRIDRRDGSFFIEDPQSRTIYYSRQGRRGFATVVLADGEERPIDRLEAVRASGDFVRFRGASSEGSVPEIELEIAVFGPLLEISFLIAEEARESIAAVRLLDGSPWVSDADGGGIVVPDGLGRFVEAAAGELAALRYEGQLRETARGAPGYSTSALGLARGDGTLLITWDDPRARLDIRREEAKDARFPGTRLTTFALEFRGARGKASLLGGALPDAGPLDVGRLYRELRARRFSGSSLRTKTGARDDLPALLGAVALRFPMSEPPSGLRARGLPRHTFRGIARLAERLREKVELPGAIFLFDDWLASGDASVPHPELFLAAAEECGGDEAFGACAERIHDLGYFVALALDREALVPHRAGTPIVGEVAWRLAELATRSPGGLSRIRDLASPDLLIVREPRGEGTAPQLLDARERFFAGANALVPLLGGNVPWDGDLDRLMWIEELLPTHQRGGLEELATMKPIFAALYQLSFRFAARPGEELAPSDAHRLLLHLLLAQPPVLEPPPELDSNGRALPPIEPSTGPEWRFAREGGFSEGRELSPHEIFIKTAAETAGYLAQYAAREPLVSFRALDDRGRVLESRFGFDLRVVVNFGPDPFTIEETGMVLPELGFWIQYPFFYAFHALAAEGVEYEEPALFTVRSLEGKLYLRAEKVRIWHGFGPAKIRLGGRDFTVERETEARIW